MFTENKNKNNNWLKTCLQVILVFFIVITLLMLFASTIVQMLAPTFFPDKNISGFIDVVQTANVLLSILSLGFGIISLFLSYQSGKQSEKILEGVSDLKSQHSTMEFMLNNIGRTFSFGTLNQDPPEPPGKPDPTID